MSVYYLDVEDVLTAASAACGGNVEVRDFGLLAAAVARPATTVYGQDAYPELETKAGALLHSLARNHALIDGNKRAAWAAAWTFLEVNGLPLADDVDVDAAEELMLAVARGEREVPDIATPLVAFAVPEP